MRSATLIAMSLTVVLIAGCATEPRFLRDDCDWAEPIRMSRDDIMTDGTLAQIVAHNEIGARLCGWRP